MSISYGGDYITDTDGGKLKPSSSVMRNRIINGAMVIDQRNAGASVTPTTANDTYAVDRFVFLVTQASKLTAQQNAGSVTPPTGFSNYLGCTSSSSYSVLTGDFFGLKQVIEGFNTADLGWGSSDAKPICLSFWVRSSLTGTFGGSIYNSAFNRSYPFSYSIPTANTWTSISVTIAGDTSGTWIGATNGAGMQVFFSLGTGATYSGTAGAWTGSGLFSATGATSVVGTSGATFFLTGCQLEVGEQATGFEYRQYTNELQLAQRYYETSFDIGTAPGNAVNDNFEGIASFGTSDSQHFGFKVYKRAAPTMTYYSSTKTGSPPAGQWQFLNSSYAWANGVATQTTRATMTGFSVYVNSSGSYGIGQASSIVGNWAASAEL